MVWPTSGRPSLPTCWAGETLRLPVQPSKQSKLFLSVLNIRSVNLEAIEMTWTALDGGTSVADGPVWSNIKGYPPWMDRSASNTSAIDCGLSLGSGSTILCTCWTSGAEGRLRCTTISTGSPQNRRSNVRPSA